MLILAGILIIFAIPYSTAGNKPDFPYDQMYRPQYHYSAPFGFQGPPEGLVHYKDIFLLNYEFDPKGSIENNRHWGHANSKDLIYWENEPISLFPTKEGDVRGGSAIVDLKNVSGFKKKNGPATIVALYTRYPLGQIENQNVWYSNDKGLTYKPYNKNPVIVADKDDNFTVFHEPKVRAYGKKFVAPVAGNDRILFYESYDLKKWKYLSEFGQNDGAHGGAWACPDLIPFEVKGKKIWVLIVSLYPGGPNVGGGTQYFLGNFNGKKFINYNDPSTILWLDYGPDFECGWTYQYTPLPYWVLIGWADNYDYVANQPTSPWKGQMTLPRELRIEYVGTNSSKILTSYPIDKVKKLERKLLLDYKNNDTTDTSVYQANFNTYKYMAKIQAILADRITVVLSNNNTNEQFSLTLTLDGTIIMDRSASGIIPSADFAMQIRGQRASSKTLVLIDIYYDSSVVEIFFDKKTSFTVLLYPTQYYNTIQISPGVGSVKKVKLIQYKSIWNNKS